MKQSKRCLVFLVICVLYQPTRAQTINELQRGFERPPDDARIMMRWWWFGPAVTKPELEREMRLMKEGGIGGFEVQPVYPLLPDDPAVGVRNLPFLSDEFIDALKFVSAKARELGLRMDLTLGSGWPYGGPSVPISEAAARLRTERVKVQPDARRVPLPNITSAEKLLAVFVARTDGQTIVADSAQDAEIYFIANTSNVKQSVEATFRVAHMQPEWWDPFSGKVAAAKIEKTSGSSTTVALDLEPYGSRVLVFSKRNLPAPASNSPPIGYTVDLSTDWRILFGKDTKPVTMDRLQSWTDDEPTRYFSGTATYEKEVTLPNDFLRSGPTLQLDFGEGKSLPEQNLRAGMQAWFDSPVREAAVVYINDQKAGSVWCPPYKLDVTRLLRPGKNQIKIVVANLALNYMAGRRLPDYRLLNLRYGERFQAQDMDKVQAIPAGLFGPIRLVSHR